MVYTLRNGHISTSNCTIVRGNTRKPRESPLENAVDDSVSQLKARSSRLGTSGVSKSVCLTDNTIRKRLESLRLTGEDAVNNSVTQLEASSGGLGASGISKGVCLVDDTVCERLEGLHIASIGHCDRDRMYIYIPAAHGKRCR